MLLRIGFRLIVLALIASGSAFAPISLRGETATPPDTSAPPSAEPAQKSDASGEKGKGHIALPSPVAEIITDLSRLPAPVARTRERLLAAARSGDLQQLAGLMTDTLPIFSFTDDKESGRLLEDELPRLGRCRGALDPDHDSRSRIRAGR